MWAVLGDFFLERAVWEGVWQRGRITLQWRNLTNTAQPGDQGQYQHWQVVLRTCALDRKWWEWPVPSVVFFLQTHSLRVRIREIADKSQLKDILQNGCWVLLQTVKVIIQNKEYCHSQEDCKCCGNLVGTETRKRALGKNWGNLNKVWTSVN